jgi:2-amino-4-hydroxy-6-hydroxymethyldihydropteridine diphosphokinase
VAPPEHRFWIGLGANLGDRLGALRAALADLAAAGVEVEATSAVYETAPQDLADQPAFLNAVARVRTPLAPLALLDALKAIEAARGRRAGGPRYGPREIDLDVLLWEGGAFAHPRLEIPHPRLAERRFALVPLLELEPEARLPDGRRLADAAAAIPAEGQPVARLSGGAGGGLP